ncbi:crossover junction endodeoxyribonuclease RuvC [Candidatus Shikimatogenerans bostrichidophilus]|uniref:crossover junction endodeoxyribonuclease RuvC n=1 Tax=Candidatus Shikimatogenerans bostrichidophilus TaxID=2943807 RepID=UPI002965E107
MNIKKKNIIIGIDPGINNIGLSVIEYYNNKIFIHLLKDIKLSNIKNIYFKLITIYLKIKKIIKLYKPTFLVIESIFLGKNVKTMINLIKLQTTILILFIYYNIPFIEYSPKTIKYIISGNGNCSKNNIKNILENILNKKLNYNKSYDYIDSLSIVICHLLIVKTKLKLKN